MRLAFTPLRVAALGGAALVVALGAFTVAKRCAAAAPARDELVVPASLPITRAALPAKTHGLVIPPGHPRLWFDPARLTRAKKWFGRNGVQARRDDPIGRLTRALLDGDKRECRELASWAVERSTKIRRDGVACDDCRWSGEAIILAYDWCHAYLSPEERGAYVAAVNGWIEHWRVQRWGGPHMPENNYNWGYLRNGILWAIASYEENASVAEALLEDAFERRLAGGFTAAAASGPMKGGIGREGTQYGIYINAYATIPWVTAGLLGRDLFSESGYWRESVYHLIYSLSPAPTTGAGPRQASSMGHTFFPYSDDEFWLQGNQVKQTAGNYMVAVAMRWPDARVGRLARRWLEVTDAPRSPFVRAIDPGGPSEPFTGLPLDYYGEGAGFLYGRTGWSPQATTFLLHLKDGPETGHSHAQWGSWQLWRDGRYLSRETVSYGETIAGWRGEGSVKADLHLGHNSLVVDGAGNRRNPWISGLARVTRLESRPEYVFAATDLGPTSDEKSALTGWVREFVFVRSLETLVVLDRVETRGADATKTVLVHCETAPEVSVRGAVCTNGDQALVVTALVPAAVTVRAVEEGGKVGQHRIEIDTRPGTAESHVLTVLQARPRRGADLQLSVKEAAEAITLELGPGARVTFAKGMTSRGGSITLGAAPQPFRDGVQPLEVGEDGPNWK